jgi:hypothetical protein
MSRLLPIVVVLTLLPGFLWWIVIAALLPGTVLLLEDLADWREGSRRRDLVPVRVERRRPEGRRR